MRPSKMEAVSLAAAKIARRCPPRRLLAEDVAHKHLEVCCWCRTLVTSTSDPAFLDFADDAPKVMENEVVEPGDLCLVRSDLAGWDDTGEFYYRAPLVIALEKDFGFFGQKSWRVSLVYDDLYLMSAEDFPFLMSADKEAFSEPWNVFLLPTFALSGVVAKSVLSPQSVREVLSLSQRRTDWLRLSSVQQDFRRLEWTVASLITVHAIDIILEDVYRRERTLVEQVESADEADEAGKKTLARFLSLERR